MATFLQKSLLGILQVLLSGEDDEESDLEDEDPTQPERLPASQRSQVQSVTPPPSLLVSNPSLGVLEYHVNSSQANGMHTITPVATGTPVDPPSTDQNVVTSRQLESNPGARLVLSNNISSQDTSVAPSDNHAENILKNQSSSVRFLDNTGGGSAH
ncbi:unnamed protein product [Rhizoctonia solani]|uniref:Uncharacterized protein n=1 Tax=Rhizoctonia solani TaxID=456999 RepID=A0A8H3BTA0_9AGAM|nr:unnamed protein product [Rhizoctonia solani]